MSLAVVAVLIVVAALAVVRVRGRLACVVSLSWFSLLVALALYLAHAPDVAIAEAAVGAGASTVLLMLAADGLR